MYTKIQSSMKCFLSTLVILFSFFYLQAQTPAQLVSTNIISQFLGNELEFDAEATERISRSAMIELIEANELLEPPVQEQVKVELGLDGDLHGWRGAIARFQADCDEITVFVVTWSDENNNEGGQVVLFIPPNNRCGSAMRALLEPIYGGYVSGTVELKRCVDYACVDASPFVAEDVRGCIEVIHLIDASFDCPEVYNCTGDEDCDDLEKEFILTVTIPG